MIVTTLDTFTSLLGGFTIFGILGNLAYNVGEKDISKVVKSGGSGLAFISYPDAIAKFTFVPQVRFSCFHGNNARIEANLIFLALFGFILFHALRVGSRERSRASVKYCH
jgi:Sodium:neurotransmitter symporter family